MNPVYYQGIATLVLPPQTSQPLALTSFPLKFQVGQALPAHVLRDTLSCVCQTGLPLASPLEGHPRWDVASLTPGLARSYLYYSILKYSVLHFKFVVILHLRLPDRTDILQCRRLSLSNHKFYLLSNSERFQPWDLADTGIREESR